MRDFEAELKEISALSASDGTPSKFSSPDEGAATALVPTQLAELDQRTSAGTFFATERTILHAEQAKRQQQEKVIASRVEAAKNEIDALKHKLAQFNIQKDLRIERLDAMEKLKDRGVETSNSVLVLRTELSDIESHRQDLLVAVVQAETRLAEVEGDSRKFALDYSESVAKELAAVDKDLREAREANLSARALSTIFFKPNNPSEQAPTYELIRQSKGGAKILSATETSPLTPGDVLKVTSRIASDSSVLPTIITPDSRE